MNIEPEMVTRAAERLLQPTVCQIAQNIKAGDTINNQARAEHVAYELLKAAIPPQAVETYSVCDHCGAREADWRPKIVADTANQSPQRSVQEDK